MKLVVFGATGSTGQQLVDSALHAGHEVIAVVRSPHKIVPQPGLIPRGGETRRRDVARHGPQGRSGGSRQRAQITFVPKLQ